MNSRNIADRSLFCIAPDSILPAVWSAYGKLGYKFGIHAISVDYGYAEDGVEDDGLNGDEFNTIGVAYVVNPWESIQFYGGYRYHTLDRRGVNNIEDISAVMIGGRVKF
jgi:hypothetical protein